MADPNSSLNQRRHDEINRPDSPPTGGGVGFLGTVTCSEPFFAGVNQVEDRPTFFGGPLRKSSPK
jgi:hypothetical protein